MKITIYIELDLLITLLLSYIPLLKTQTFFTYYEFYLNLHYFIDIYLYLYEKDNFLFS